MDMIQIDGDSVPGIVAMFEGYLDDKDASDESPDFVLSSDFRDVLLFLSRNRSDHNDYVLEWLLELQTQYFQKLDIEEFEEKLECWLEWRAQCQIWQNMIKRQYQKMLDDKMIDVCL
jgi:hypothetical protein